MTIPTAIEKLAEDVFIDDYKIKEVYYLSDKPKEFSQDVFSSQFGNTYNTATLYVTEKGKDAIPDLIPWKYFNKISTDISSAIDDILVEKSSVYDIYTIDGHLLYRNINSEYVNQLPAGMYLLQDSRNGIYKRIVK